MKTSDPTNMQGPLSGIFGGEEGVFSTSMNGMNGLYALEKASCMGVSKSKGTFKKRP